jgi:hypothetical protein
MCIGDHIQNFILAEKWPMEKRAATTQCMLCMHPLQITMSFARGNDDVASFSNRKLFACSNFIFFFGIRTYVNLLSCLIPAIVYLWRRWSSEDWMCDAYKPLYGKREYPASQSGLMNL